MRYEILDYNELHDTHLCKDKSGKHIHLDLFTDSSFPEVNESTEFEKLERQKYRDYMKGLIGRTFEADEIFPYIPSYFVKNGSWINGL